jgi:hypothetical protein
LAEKMYAVSYIGVGHTFVRREYPIT